MFCDVGIVGEHIAALGVDLGAGKREIDASGAYVMPGLALRLPLLFSKGGWRPPDLAIRDPEKTIDGG